MSSNNSAPFDQSLLIGENAFSSLIEETVPVWPDMYEVLYAYRSGHNDDVNAAIDGLKKTTGQLTSNDLFKIHDSFFSDAKLLDVSENIGSRINDEIRNIIEAMNDAGDKSEECDTALRKIETKFSSVTTPEQLQGVVDILSDITRAVANNNKNLNTRLKNSSQEIEILHKDLDAARNESNTDALTGLPNRKKFDHELRNFVPAFLQENGDLSLLLVDIDHFKKFNDNYGHQTGDQILRLVAQTLKSSLKGRDLPARYGGEEFGVILPGTSSGDAFTVAEQIREAIAAKELIKRSTGDNLGRLTVSIGIAQASADDTPSTLIARSDKALYKAKDAGRNCCIISPGVIIDEFSELTQ